VTCPAIPSVISSRVSGAGPRPSIKQAGTTIARSGPEAVPVSPSPTPDAAKAPQTLATSGLSGSPSFASAALQSSLASRLQRRFATDGSMLFVQTWREKATPAGRRYWAHTASARRTSDSGAGSWPSPTAALARKSVRTLTGAVNEARRRSWQNDLQTSALGTWPTPDAQLMNVFADPVKHQARRDQLKIRYRNNGAGLPLGQAVLLVSWGTPSQRDHKDVASVGTAPVRSLLGRQVWGIRASASGPPPTGSSAKTAKPGQLNPAHSRWLMGYPPEWDACAATVAPSSRRLPKRS
jgi:hypothetical protein